MEAFLASWEHVLLGLREELSENILETLFGLRRWRSRSPIMTGSIQPTPTGPMIFSSGPCADTLRGSGTRPTGRLWSALSVNVTPAAPPSPLLRRPVGGQAAGGVVEAAAGGVAAPLRGARGRRRQAARTANPSLSASTSRRTAPAPTAAAASSNMCGSRAAPGLPPLPVRANLASQKAAEGVAGRLAAGPLRRFPREVILLASTMPRASAILGTGARLGTSGR